MSVRPDKQRYETAIRLRREGKKLREIGEALNVSVERARSMIATAERMERVAALPADARWDEALTVRTRNVLHENEYKSREEVLADIQSGKLRAKYGRIGPKGIDEICDWLGIERIPPKPTSQKAIKAAISLLERSGYTVTRPAQRRDGRTTDVRS